MWIRHPPHLLLPLLPLLLLLLLAYL